MNCKLNPVGHGNHNNIHFNFAVKNLKINLIIVKLNVLEDKGYIMSMKFPGINQELINLNNLYFLISEKLKRYDVSLIVLDKTYFENTEELLEYLKK
jgi:hypothetical protein